jgi:SAM-dependent methyltransferase
MPAYVRGFGSWTWDRERATRRSSPARWSAQKAPSVGIDLAESMLAVAARKAKTLGLQQVSFRTGDVTSLPFETGSIDAVISRFCLMFLPEIPKAAAEIARVLKPGGYVAAAVWSSPDKNPFIRIPMDVIKSITPLPPPDPEAPGIFRLAKPGDLAGMLQRAGLTPLDDEEFTAEVAYESGEEFFRGLMDIAAPIQNLFRAIDAGTTGRGRTGDHQGRERLSWAARRGLPDCRADRQRKKASIGTTPTSSCRPPKQDGGPGAPQSRLVFGLLLQLIHLSFRPLAGTFHLALSAFEFCFCVVPLEFFLHGLGLALHLVDLPFHLPFGLFHLGLGFAGFGRDHHANRQTDTRSSPLS